MTKINLIIILALLFNGFINGQNNDLKKCKCDSLLKAKIESRIMFAINGRSVKGLIKPNNNTCEIGIFEIDIIVNREGQVINAGLNKKNSSLISDQLKTVLIDAALKSRFMGDNDSPLKQKGSLTYEFRMKDDKN